MRRGALARVRRRLSVVCQARLPPLLRRSDATETASSGQLVLSPAAHDALTHGAVGQAYHVTGVPLKKREFLLEKIERSSHLQERGTYVPAAPLGKSTRGEPEEAEEAVDYEP